MKQLSKEEMKKVMGGVIDFEVEDPGSGIGCYKCCWDSDPGNCSRCVQNDGKGPCQAGASLHSCESPCPYQ